MSQLNEAMANVPTAEAVKKGDLITIGADGKARFAVEPGSALAKFRPLHQQEAVTAVNAVAETYFLDVDAPDASACAGLASLYLKNGNFAVAFVAQSQVQVSVFTNDGALVDNTKLGLSDGVHLDVALTALPSGNFAVAYCEGAAAQLKVALFNCDAVMIHSGVIVPTTAAPTSLSLAAFNDSSFVLAFCVSDQPFFVRFSAAGEPQSAVTSVDSASSSPVGNNQSVKVITLAGGTFVVVYAQVSDLSGFVFLQVFSAAGLPLSQKMAVGENLTLLNNVGPFVTAAAMNGGGFAVGTYGGKAPGYQLNIFGATGVAQGGTIVLDAFGGEQLPNRMALAGLESGNVGVVWSSTLVTGAVYAPDGTAVFVRAGYAPGSGSVALDATIHGAVVAFQGQVDGQAEPVLYVGEVNNLLYGETSPTAIAAGKLGSRPVVFALQSTLGSYGSQFMAGIANDNVQLVKVENYSIMQQSLIGVADADTAADQAVPVRVAGAVTLRVPFKQPFAADFNTSSVSGITPGQKISVIGDLAILKGIQS